MFFCLFPFLFISFPVKPLVRNPNVIKVLNPSTRFLWRSTEPAHQAALYKENDKQRLKKETKKDQNLSELFLFEITKKKNPLLTPLFIVLPLHKNTINYFIDCSGQ